MTVLKPVQPVLAKSGRLEYRYPGATVWFKNPQGGLEQGVTIAKAPVGPTTTTLTVNFQVAGGLKPRASGSHQFIQFTQNGKPVLSYAGLGVWDATGKRLGSHMTVTGTQVSIGIDDAGATYPLTVDPYFSAQELINSDAGPADWFGSSVEMTPDGQTAIIGALEHGNIGPDPNSQLYGPGAVYVFTRSGSSYVQTQELAPSDGGLNDQFGESIAISDDGSVILVGANGHNGGLGAAYVFTKDGGSYSQTGEFTGSDTKANDFFGSPLALSGDGNYAIVGDPFLGYNRNGWQPNGNAYIFQRSGGTYVQTYEFPSSGGWSDFGVAIDGTGSTVAINGNGGTRVYTLQHGVPTGGPQLLNGCAQVALGGLSMNADGSRVLVGCFADGQTGAASVFDRTGGSYAQTARLAAPDGVSGDQFGAATALSQDGNVALIGALYKPGVICTDGNCVGNFGPGAAYVFTHNESGWDDTAGLAAYDGSNVSQFGNAVALNGDGSVALIGSETHNNGAGAAYVFGPTGATATTSVKLTSGSNPSSYGDSLTFTAKLGPIADPPPTGSVEFWAGPPSDAGSVELGSAEVDNYLATLATTAVPAGSQRVYAVYNGSPSFAGSQNSVSQSVNPVPATITATDETAATGSPLPTLAWTVSSLVNGDTAASIPTPPACTTTASVDSSGNIQSPPGQYSIDCSAAIDANYQFSYVSGTLNVTAAG